MAKTLEELKAENAAEEQAQAETEVIEAESEEVEDEVEAIEAEASEGEPEATVEAWEAEDDPASESDKKFSDSDVAAIRRKLKAKLTEKDSELERLKAEVQALKQGTQRPVTDAGKVPTLEMYDYDEGKYAAAMKAWVMSEVTNVTKVSEAQTVQQKRMEAQQRNVESHYERAANLVKERAIDPTLYHSADEAFRRSIEAAVPGQGDLIAEQLIARLGEGSEKVTFYVGRNATEREVLKAKLMEDPSGLSASMYLGRLVAKVSMPVQKTTKAPAPAARAEGGQSSNADSMSLKRKYEKAKDVQDRIDIKRQAKRAGIDVSKW